MASWLGPTKETTAAAETEPSLSADGSRVLTAGETGFVVGQGDGLLHVFVPHATAGLAIEAAAIIYGLAFARLTTERYDLVVPEQAWQTEPVQALAERGAHVALARGTEGGPRDHRHLVLGHQRQAGLERMEQVGRLGHGEHGHVEGLVDAALLALGALIAGLVQDRRRLA